MTRMKGLDAFLIARYIVFGLFMICNAVTCSVAVWNFSLIPGPRPSPIDVYLIFVGAFALLSIFIFIFIELLCFNAVTTRVWFECTWITFFWTMELAGGAALVAIGSNTSCSNKAIPSIGTLCTSGRLLLASTWISTITLFCYLLALVFTAASRYSEHPQIWSSDVRTLRTTAVSQWSPNLPSSPYSTRLKKHTDADVYTPQPVRARPPQFLHHQGFGLATDYEIEPFRPVFASPEHALSESHLPEAIPLPPSATAPVAPSYMKPTSALLDFNFDRPRELASTVTYANSGGPSEPVARQSIILPSPPPLGDWPRPDIMKHPAKSKRKSPPPSAFEFPNRHMATVSPNDRPATCEVGPVATHRVRRPSGPRSRVPSVESVHRPTPLDLSGIGNHAM